MLTPIPPPLLPSHSNDSVSTLAAPHVVDSAYSASFTEVLPNGTEKTRRAPSICASDEGEKQGLNDKRDSPVRAFGFSTVFVCLVV